MEDYSKKPHDYYASVRPMLIPFIPNNIKKVLDVGCGEGGFGRMLKDTMGADEVWGVEYFEGAAIIAKNNLDKIIHSKIEDAIDQLPDNYFDCIFFNDVLEHLVDPYSVLEKIKSKCKANGSIVASIPNILNFENLYLFLKNQDWEYKPYGIMDKTHLRFFTKKSVHRMFIEAGYKVEMIKCENPFYGRKFKILNFLFFNKLDQMKYVHIVIRATPN